jgi:transcriptional regulator with XRE-family HTH domain
MFVYPERRMEAERLRRELGLSVKEIARRVEVSASTASRWLRGVPLTPEQAAALEAANPALNGRHLGARRVSENARAERLNAQAHGRELARRGDALHRCGCMLYWAEGSKGRNHVIFTNSDVAMMQLFVRFLRRCYAVADDDMRLSVNVHLGNGVSVEEIEGWWLNALGLPASCIRKTAVNRVSRASLRKRRPLPYGTARLVVGSTFVVQSIYGAIQAYGGFERSAWVA